MLEGKTAEGRSTLGHNVRWDPGVTGTERNRFFKCTEECVFRGEDWKAQKFVGET